MPDVKLKLPVSPMCADAERSNRAFEEDELFVRQPVLTRKKTIDGVRAKLRQLRIAVLITNCVSLVSIFKYFVALDVRRSRLWDWIGRVRPRSSSLLDERSGYGARAGLTTLEVLLLMYQLPYQHEIWNVYVQQVKEQALANLARAWGSSDHFPPFYISTVSDANGCIARCCLHRFTCPAWL